ncbi:hypothetical protein NT6N_40560 [Oceaniferula spumae]|uniref:DUF4190 domain-containing protein n=1 Tax=Oceaniferula spumae TaxID=2979115 RepID=A0AAT9FSK4_9BACT
MLQQPPPAYPNVAPGRTSGLAIASLVCGIASFVPIFIGSLAAIICGHMALSQIKKSGQQLTGKGMAIAGMILGYLTFAICLIAMAAAIATPVVMKQKQKAESIDEMNRAKILHTHLLAYEKEHGKFPPTLGTLVDEGYITSLDDLLTAEGEGWYYYYGQDSKADPDNILLFAPKSGVALHISGETKWHKGYSDHMHALSSMKNYDRTQE